MYQERGCLQVAAESVSLLKAPRILMLKRQSAILEDWAWAPLYANATFITMLFFKVFPYNAP
jgi:hypothetical protein